VNNLRTYTRLRPQRIDPRRDEGRVQHGRMKERTVDPSPEQERYHDSLRFFPDGKRRPCQCGCGRIGEAIHHLLARVPGKGGRRDHWFVVLLSHSCHNLGRDSVHGCGSEAKFKEVHGVDLPAIAVANLNAWEAERG
jgi:hypothetical protein